jgi:hypothetical protein
MSIVSQLVMNALIAKGILTFSTSTLQFMAISAGSQMAAFQM